MPTRSRRLSTPTNPEVPARREQPRVRSPRALLTLNFHQTPLQRRSPPGPRCASTMEPPQGASRGGTSDGSSRPGSVLRAMGARPFPWQRLPGPARQPLPLTPQAPRPPGTERPRPGAAEAPPQTHRAAAPPHPPLLREAPGAQRTPTKWRLPAPPGLPAEARGRRVAAPPGGPGWDEAGRRPPADGGTQWWQRVNPMPYRFSRLSSPPARATALKHMEAERAGVASPQDGQQDFAVRG